MVSFLIGGDTIKQHEKELLQRQLDSEKGVLRELEKHYKKALEDIDDRIAALLGRQDADLQHVIFQVEYQKQLKTQVQAILEQLQAVEFDTISEYLSKCYEEGFVGSLYSIQKQGVPLVFPVDQRQVVEAVQLDSKISEGLYTRLGKDVKELKKNISSEITRGISAAMAYSEIARNVNNVSQIGLNRAKRIARTEGGRIQNKAAMDTMRKAKAIGADVVKRWSAALDARTRDSHARIDGEVREVEEKFSNGLMYPKDPSGSASEVVNCRCKVQEIARWALDDEETAHLGNTDKMTDEQLEPIAKKLNISVDELRGYSGQIIPVRAKNYEDFKRQYDKIWHYKGSDLQRESETRIASYGKKKSPKTLDNSGESSKITTKQVSSKIKDGTTVVNPMDEAKYKRLKVNLEKQGIHVIQAEGDDLRYLQSLGAEASYGYGYIMHIGAVPSASGLFEEIIHSTQAKVYGEFVDSNPVELYAREIAANRKLLRNGKAYGFDEVDFEDIRRNLAAWETKFKNAVGVTYDESGYSREV